MTLRQIHPERSRTAPAPVRPSHRVLGAVALVAALGLLVTLAPTPVPAAEPVNATTFGNLAIEGYDPVAYFEQGGPAEGSEEHTFEWRGATWRFASADNRDLFAADPEKYAPQYGGYCAYAVAKGKTAGIDPDAWQIVDGKLYLQNSERILERWREDIPGHIAAADENWPRLVED